MPLRQPTTQLLTVSLAGGLGGAINAGLCYLRLPVPVQDSAAKFHWHIVPAGFAHGATLALLAVGSGLFLRPLSKALVCFVSLLVGWVAGYASGIPLHLSAFDKTLADALIWPWDGMTLLESAWMPFPYFGAVATFVYLWLGLRPLHVGTVWSRMVALSAAAALGSLWWWIDWGPWYFSLLHGTIWGLPVGLVLRSTREKGTQRPPC